MAKELIINASLPEVRIALMEDGRIQELLIERESEKGIVGNIYKGRVTRVLPGMQAAFVDVGLDKAAFLYVDDIYVHPKVMGEETEVEESYDDSHEEQNDDQGQHEEQNAGSGEGHEVQAHSEAEAMDTSSLESHVAEHVEEEFSHELDEEDDSSESDEDDSFDDEEADFEAMEAEAAGELEASGAEQSDEGGEGHAESHSVDADGNPVQNAESAEGSAPSGPVAEGSFVAAAKTEGSLDELAEGGGRKSRFRGRNRNRRRGRGKDQNRFAGGESFEDQDVPESFSGTIADKGEVASDRAQMEGEARPTQSAVRNTKARPEFREQRNRDRRIKSKHSKPRAQANISDLLREGQEVIVQVAKDPIATKGARLTCHVSLPGRHLVCMPTIDHVGVSRRIERDDERRALRDFVERNRPKNMGFIVRTASGGKDPESWIKQDIDYLSKLWTKIRNRADDVSAPSIVYEDLNSVLRAIRDWVNEDIDKIIVDSRYHFNELNEFAERFMPSLNEKIELYQGDIPIFDAYGISSELHRSLERKVWLKSGGYIVIDQAEALVAIDVNTGRFVGKKNLEDTILKTNLEACDEIAYQLRLRNCGGMIVVDLIDMERDENKMRVYRAMDDALRQDRARPTIQKISELGLIEMTRKRTRDTIIRTLCEPCVQCEGKGFTKSTRTVAYEILREIERMGVDRDAKKVLVSAHEGVVDILAIDLRDVLDTLEKRYNKTVYLQGMVDFHGEQFEVVTDRVSGKKPSQDIARQLRVERERTERKEKQKQRQKETSHRRDHGRDEGRDEGRNEGRIEARNEGRDAGDEEQVESAPTRPALPTKKAEGAFVISAATIQARKDSDKAANRTAEPKSEDGEPTSEEPIEAAAEGAESFDDEEQRPQPQPRPQRGHSDGMEDEDQLAYLRAQAAQDAALARTQGASPSQGNERNPGRQPRNQNNRNNNQRNQNQRGGRGGGGGGGRGGRDQGGQGQGKDRGAGRFRPQYNSGPNQQSYSRPQNPAAANTSASFAAGPAPSPGQIAIEVPDYEVLVKSGGEGSES